MQEAKAACSKEIEALKEAQEAELSKAMTDLDGWRKQVSQLHEELMSVRTELVNARTESENMYHSHLVPIQVVLLSQSFLTTTYFRICCTARRPKTHSMLKSA
jgi:hypothetical protein